MKFKKLHLVFFLSLGTGMLLAMIFLIHVVISSLGEIRSLGAEELIAIRTRGTVQKISKEINRQIARSRAIASILARFKPQTHPWKEDSESISLMVRDFLGASPGLGGAFLYWISDSDNVDKSSRKSVASPGPAGLFAPYWTRGGDGGLFKSRLLENEFLCPDGRPGPWFGRARETGMAVITSPFRGRIGGSVVSLVVPLIYGGEFKGVLGLDLDLKFVQSMADRFAKGGDTLLLMNHKGVVLGLSGIPDMVGRDVEFGLDGTGAMHSLPGKLSIVHKGENRVEVTAPVKFDKAFSSWILKVVTSLSLEKDHMPIPWIKIIALAVLCVGLILVSTAVALTRWVSPFSRVSFHVQEMVKGDFTVRIPCDPGHDASNICEKLNMLGELLDKRAGILEEVARGNLSGKTEILSARDAMGMALDKLLSGLKSRVIHVDALAAGNFSRTPKVFGDRDRFGSSLTRITDSLRSSVVALENLGDEKSSVETKAGQENHSLNHAVKRVAERIRDERWAFVGRLELMQKMLGQRETIFPEVIAFLCRYLDVQTGNIFLYEQEACLLRRCGCFSPVEGSENIDTVSADHGYLGQVLKDKESIVVGEVDDSFRPLVFSSFQILPKFMIYAPLIHEDEVCGVLELGTVMDFSPEKMLFLKQVSGAIAKKIRFLREGLDLGEALKKKDLEREEMMIQMENLRVSNREMSHKLNQVDSDKKVMKTSGNISLENWEAVGDTRIQKVLDVNKDKENKNVNHSVKEKKGGESSGLRILLAEDNRMNQKVALAMLKKMDHQVSLASDGKEALEAYRNEKFDLILMDCQMPEMTGMEATARIRKMEGGKSHIPIVAFTASAMKGDREKFLEAGMDDFISKPIMKNALASVIERCMQKQ